MISKLKAAETLKVGALLAIITALCFMLIYQSKHLKAGSEPEASIHQLK
jgi:hypothetical protein